MPSTVSLRLARVPRMTLLLLIGLWSGELGVTHVHSQKPAPRRDELYPPPATIAMVAPMRVECINETGVSPDAIKRFSDEDIFEDDRNLKCYMDCLFRKSEIIDAKGQMDPMRMLDMVPPEFEDIFLRMGVRCLKPKGKDPCDRAFWYHKCWKTADPVHYYLI